MTTMKKAVKILLVILCVTLVVVPSVMLYFSIKETKEIAATFAEYKLVAAKALEEEKQNGISNQKETNFPNIQYEHGDTDYGSCGVALSPTFPDMVVDWREDPVYKSAVKTAYLTFDDGPSERTPEILDILDKYGVKATFFVIGNKNEDDKKLYNEIVKRGHSLGLHSQTHKYSQIYSSLDSFLADYDALFTELVAQTGETPVLFRFPGGSTNSTMAKLGTFGAIKEEMLARGFIYYDWNVSAEDAVYKYISPEDITANVVNGAKSKDTAVVLMHDSAGKQTTVAALPGIIEGLKQEGFVLDKITPCMRPVRFK